jgi:hypothetical protein
VSTSSSEFEISASHYADHTFASEWSGDRVIVIDDDQSQIGRTADQLGGFQRLIGQVMMGRVYRRKFTTPTELGDGRQFSNNRRP